MKMPPLLLGFALIFWGWQTGQWILAVPMALIFEASRLLLWRWDLSTADFRRISNLCMLLLLVLSVYIVISAQWLRFVYIFFQWLPIALFPLLAAQTYSTSDRISIRTLFIFLKQDDRPRKKTLNLTYPYFAVCILSASAGNSRELSFYIGMFLLISLVLWSIRSDQFSPILWLSMLILAGSLGFVGQIGLHNLHLALEGKAVEWLSNFYTQDPDPIQRGTAIGAIGLLKLDNSIIFRVAAPKGQTTPSLLREATYNKYQSGMWVAANSEFTPVPPDPNGTTWPLAKPVANSSEITVSASLRSGKSLLKLPQGSFQVDRLPVSSMDRNQYGTVKVAGKPQRLSYQILFDRGVNLDSSPREEDMLVPDREKPALDRIISQLDLEGKSPQEILKRVDSFFQENFSYTLELAGKDKKSTPLAVFLLQNRSGHCEFFATATTLLLRAAGIPARYAIGYSVHEFSRLENQFIVRSRHSHAWTLAYIDGAWQVLDTTPASWTSIEDAAAPKWAVISDFWSLLSFKLSAGLQLRGSQYWWWLLIALILVMLWRFARQKRVLRRLDARNQTKIGAQQPPTGGDSELYLIEKVLKESGFTRHHSETMKNWLSRLEKDLPASYSINELKGILELHYRYRFDPQGITPAERRRLKSAIRSWLETRS